MSSGITISIVVGATILCAVVALLTKCYLNWRKQKTKQQKRSASSNGTVQKLIISSQPVDFVPLLIQDQLEEVDEETENTRKYAAHRSAENLLDSRDESKVSCSKSKTRRRNYF